MDDLVNIRWMGHAIRRVTRLMVISPHSLEESIEARLGLLLWVVTFSCHVCLIDNCVLDLMGVCNVLQALGIK